jgi:hypothetical protein
MPSHLQVLPAGEVLIDGCGLSRQRDPAAHRGRLPHDIMAEHRGVPATGRSSVARIRTVVVLPTPLRIPWFLTC